MAKIDCRIRIQAPAAKVYEAVSSGEGLARWYTRTCTADARVGGEVQFKFRRGEVMCRMRVDELLPEEIRWTCVENNVIPEWEKTTIMFELNRGLDGETELHFVHDGWADETEWFEHCADGWDYFLKSLKEYVETGTGTPDAGG